MQAFFVVVAFITASQFACFLSLSFSFFHSNMRSNRNAQNIISRKSVKKNAVRENEIDEN